MDSSVDVCDLMIELLCAECPSRACAENESDDQGEPIWSHSKLMDCIREKMGLSSWILVPIDEGILGTISIHKTEEEAKTKFKSIYGVAYDDWCDSDTEAYAELKANGITTEIVGIKEGGR